ncbi:MAG: NUDIX domain-containing protein [Parachlamydiaceae bacterium]|nr:NUDIX domain-containing protein [Parachlamydiaceae bacterium]
MNTVGFKQLTINNEEELKIWLNKFPNIKANEWIKSPLALYNEIKNSECVFGLEEGKLYRRLDVVSVKCFHTNPNGQRFQIFEEKQVFKNGMIRERGNKYIAEKIQAGESPEQAAIRGLAEELHISGPNVQVVALSEENKFEKRESPTYKGIQCSYNTYSFSCEISDVDYKSSYVEEQDDKSTVFSWVKI